MDWTIVFPIGCAMSLGFMLGYYNAINKKSYEQRKDRITLWRKR